jgi:hypothetical protein
MTTGSTIALHCNKRCYDAAMRRAVACVIIVLLCAATAAFAAEPPALAKARELYNAADYEGAIAAATAVRQLPQWADAAALVIARSHLERHRRHADPADLVAARESLASVRASMLSPRDQVDLVVGLGQSLYLAELYGPAAELFGSALGRGTLVAPRDRLLLLEWWATALDREALGRAPDRRAGVLSRIVDRMELELREDPGSRVANYWLAAAARGAGDLDRAWDAAIAAWIRASLTAEGPALREDLDRLVNQALIPERARQRPSREQDAAVVTFRAEWEQIKSQWK